MSFDFDFFRQNLKKLSISSFKLYLIRTFPDSLFILFVPLLFSEIFSDVDYAALVFLISLIGIKVYPILTLVIQKNMDLIKKYHFKTNFLSKTISNFNQKESILVLLIISFFLIFEIIYISYFTKPLIITLEFFGYIFWILPLVFLRYFVNSIIEVKMDLTYKINSFFISSIFLLLMYYFNVATIFYIIIVYWINLLQLTIKHIKNEYLSLDLFFKFYKNYFIVGSLFHLNYYLLSNSNNILLIENYLFISIMIVLSLTIIYRNILLDEIKKIRLNKFLKN